MSRVLTLEAAEFRDPRHWYWRLKDAMDHQIGDHTVKLDASDWQYSAFLNLDAYLRAHAAADRRREHERQLVDHVGAWIGKNVFGPLGPKIVEGLTPVTVHVVIPAQPEGAAGLLNLPLELGHVGGKPLALQDVSLVFEVRGRRPGARTATITKKEVLTGSNKPEDFVLALVEVDGDTPREPCCVRRTFEREPDFGVTSVNYDLGGLLGRAETIVDPR